MIENHAITALSVVLLVMMNDSPCGEHERNLLIAIQWHRCVKLGRMDGICIIKGNLQPILTDEEPPHALRDLAVDEAPLLDGVLY